MHPAPSVILFSVLSGMGFGFLAILNITTGFDGVTGPFGAFWSYFVGYAFAVSGLLFATLHLGNPKNAWKAFREWRSSWLAREGVAAVISLCLTGVYAAALIFFDMRLVAVGIIAALLCIFTVFTTSMIYAQLKTVPRWNQFLTPFVFLVAALAGGDLLALSPVIAEPMLYFLGAVVLLHWAMGDRAFTNAGSTIETATGLGRIGKTRLLESPHSGKNYLLTEMVYVIGRKHAMKLRVIGFVLAIGLPLLVLWAVPSLTAWIMLGVLVSHLLGMLTIRWLFFAEAEHVVGLYYDAR